MGAQRLFIVIAGLWVGSLLAVGYLVAPAIFSTMSDRQAAGMVAGSIFKLEAYLSLIVCIGLMVLANLLVNRDLNQYRLIRWLLLAMLLCSIAAAFVFIPWMNALRDVALAQGMPVMLSPSATLFGRLHGASSILFMLQSLLGIFLVWRLTKR
ncbi:MULTISPECIES: DUF4149 domain-containing protein [unclassified Polynucleobacter]|uniref:DUF4149 domain-containing protein n=1 Tax=unclassified Polynucleobacter TaxID=2640945 RepID=UPI0008B0FA0B|nr:MULTISPECIES: DUF4149 domain-containing protein [unclassified Polynucleobacter]OHC10194.1 MAG: hypothetical protein A2X74_10635 [Polynucleobacter sp. GWA2_45_21]HBK43694.1 DUF4149 domain-containing protein [Polynucleobacter sp.]